MPKTQEDLIPQSQAAPRRLASLLRAAIHEMNTPLAVLQNYAELLEPHLAGKEAEAHLATMRQELARLVSVVADLSLRNELASGTLTFRVAPLEVESLLSDLAPAVEAQHPGRLVAFCYPGRLPDVMVDPDHLRFLLWTLLHNAAHYSPRRCRMIEMAIRPGAGVMEFRVQDSAPSLWPKYGEAVFEPLPELPPALHRPRFGFGTGLFAAREVARQMGGDLWVERLKGRRGKPGTGNVFVLRLPLAEAHKP